MSVRARAASAIADLLREVVARGAEAAGQVRNLIGVRERRNAAARSTSWLMTIGAGAGFGATGQRLPWRGCRCGSDGDGCGLPNATLGFAVLACQ